MSDNHNGAKKTGAEQARHSQGKAGTARRRGGRKRGRGRGGNGGKSSGQAAQGQATQSQPAQSRATQGRSPQTKTQPATPPSTQGKPMRRRKKRRRPNQPSQAAATAAPNPTKPNPATPNQTVPSATANSAPPSRKRRRKGKGRSGKVGNNVQYIGQVTNDTSVPTPAPPRRRGKRKRPLANPRIGVGCIILRDDEILLVRERGRWSLPKGGLEQGELVQDGARRETYEESGLVIELRDLAFIVEFKSDTWGHHLQFFYTGRVVGGELGPKDPDKNVQEALFVPISQLREHIRFRPRLMSLETWLDERQPRHFVFDLDHEPAMTRRRRVSTGK